MEKQKYLNTLVEKVKSIGYPEEQVERLISLHKAIDVSNRLMHLLEERYGQRRSSEKDPEAYGPEEFQAFRNRIIDEYSSLQKLFGLTI